MMDKKFLGNYSPLVLLEGTRQIKESFIHVKKKHHILQKGLLDFYHDWKYKVL